MVFDGSGFLYNQVRHMAGCLLAIGRGKPIDIRELLKTGKSDHPGSGFPDVLILFMLLPRGS